MWNYYSTIIWNRCLSSLSIWMAPTTLGYVSPRSRPRTRPKDENRPAAFAGPKNRAASVDQLWPLAHQLITNESMRSLSGWLKLEVSINALIMMKLMLIITMTIRSISNKDLQQWLISRGSTSSASIGSRAVQGFQPWCLSLCPGRSRLFTRVVAWKLIWWDEWTRGLIASQTRNASTEDLSYLPIPYLLHIGLYVDQWGIPPWWWPTDLWPL